MKKAVLGLFLFATVVGYSQDYASEIRNGNVEFVKAYAEKNGNLNRSVPTEIELKTCSYKGDAHYLELAALYNKTKMVNLLLEHAARIDSLQTHINQSFLAALANGNVEMTKSLYKHNPDVNASFKNCENKKALMLALESRNTELLNIVRSMPIDHWNVKGEQGITPMHLAAENGDVETIKVLMANNVEVNPIDEDGLTPLLLAFLNNHTFAAEYLVKFAGPVVHQKDPTGNTALCYAAKFGMERAAATLVEKGAKIDCSCSEFNSALEMAIRKKETSVVRAMLIAAEGRPLKNGNKYVKIAQRMGMPDDIIRKINLLR